MVNIIQYVEVPYDHCKLFHIKTIQVAKRVCRVIESQKWKNIEISNVSRCYQDFLSQIEAYTGIQRVKVLYLKKSSVLKPMKCAEDAELANNIYLIEFLKHEKPTNINRLIKRPRKDFKNFVCDVNLLAEYIVQYIQTVDNRRVFPNVVPGFMNNRFNMEDIDKPMKLKAILKDFETKILPGNANWNHINFRSYFSSRNFASGALADLAIGSMYAVLCNWAMSPSGVEFELQMVSEYGKLMGLPDIFLTHTPNADGCGITLSATSEGVIMSMLTARELMFKKLSFSRKERFEVHSKLVAYVSDQAHSCHERAAKLANVECQILETDKNGSLQGATLEEAIEKDIANGKLPFFFSLSLGSTGIIAFDNLKEIGDICEKHEIWIHADLAYTSSALICPEYRYIISGIEKVTSISCNLYKWIGLNTCVSLFYTKRGNDYKSVFSMNPDYLNYEHQNENRFKYDHMDTSITLSRPCRGIKLWFHIRLNGLRKLQSIVRKHCQLAEFFGDLVSQDTRFELFKVELSVAVFRYSGLDDNFNRRLSASLIRSGEMYLTMTSFKNKTFLRFLVGAPDESRKDVVNAWKIILKHAEEIESQYQLPSNSIQIKTEPSN